MFLVVARCTFDEVPLFLTESLVEAKAKADWLVSGEDSPRLEAAVNRVTRRLGFASSGVVNVAIVEFAKTGSPKRVRKTIKVCQI